MTEPVQYPPAVLRVAPEAIPALRSAIDATIGELRPLLTRMRDEAHIPEPWLGDSASHETWALYTEQVMGATDGAFHGMIAYERQLVAIRERLTEIEGRYAATESDAAARFGRTL